MATKQEKIEAIKIQQNASIVDALKIMDSTYRRLLLVFEGNRFINILSIGDIQRAIIKNKPLNAPVSSILRKETLISTTSDSSEDISIKMLDQRIECMPIVDESQSLVDVIFWEDVFA